MVTMNVPAARLKNPIYAIATACCAALPVRVVQAAYSRWNKVIIDAAIVVAALWIAYAIRFDGVVPLPEKLQFRYALLVIVPIYIGCSLVWAPQNRVWRFFDLKEALILACSVACAAFICIVWRLAGPYTLTRGPVPMGVLLIHPFLAYTGWSVFV